MGSLGFVLGTAAVDHQQVLVDQLADQLKLLERQSRLELAYYTALDEKTREVRKIRHDFNNQLQTAYSVFAQGRPEEAQKHLQQLERRIEEASPVYFCGNPILNALLWDKQKEAKARQVAFQADVRLPEETGIEQIDLCSVFSNLLDNAAEAAASCEKGGVSVYLILAFATGGCVDTISKFFSVYGSPENQERFIFYTFVAALIMSIGVCIYKDRHITKKDIAVGIIVGIPNELAALLLLKAAGMLPAYLVYPCYSAGVIFAVNIVNMIVFREFLSKREYIATGIIAIALILINM